jgi:hypothetical protein
MIPVLFTTRDRSAMGFLMAWFASRDLEEDRKSGNSEPDLMSEKVMKVNLRHSRFKLMAGEWKVWLSTLLLAGILMGSTVTPLFGNFDHQAIRELPPGERYRQLSLLLLVSGGIDPELLESLQPLVTKAESADPSGTFVMALEDYSTPLARIVDQETMLASATQMFVYARENSAAIQTELSEIAAANPILVSMVDVNQIAEEAIIIRNAIADSIEYTEMENTPEGAQRLQNFRNQTIYLRNMMEFNIFQEELAQITNEAILDLGGRLDAYERMFQDEVDQELIQRRIQSAEMMNAQTGRHFDDQATLRTNELLMMLILMESQVR